MASSAPTDGHAALMDSVYRRQKLIYDATRKYYLFGRDTLIAGLEARPGATVLEVGSGTGRNLALIGRRWPGVKLHGLDISEEMLSIARAKLGASATLAQGDATDFDARKLLGSDRFDRVVISFAVSMIPVWRDAVRHAAGLLAPGGSLHIVDFHDFSGLPAFVRKALNGWLAKFHVAPRLDLAEFAQGVAAQAGLTCEARRGPFGYYRLVILRAPQ